MFYVVDLRELWDLVHLRHPDLELLRPGLGMVGLLIPLGLIALEQFPVFQNALMLA